MRRICGLAFQRLRDESLDLLVGDLAGSARTGQFAQTGATLRQEALPPFDDRRLAGMRAFGDGFGGSTFAGQEDDPGALRIRFGDASSAQQSLQMFALCRGEFDDDGWTT